jgi:hypothetical protein
METRADGPPPISGRRFHAEDVVIHRVNKGKKEYLVDFTGYNSSWWEWCPESHINASLKRFARQAALASLMPGHTRSRAPPTWSGSSSRT